MLVPCSASLQTQQTTWQAAIPTFQLPYPHAWHATRCEQQPGIYICQSILIHVWRGYCCHSLSLLWFMLYFCVSNRYCSTLMGACCIVYCYVSLLDFLILTSHLPNLLIRVADMSHHIISNPLLCGFTLSQCLQSFHSSPSILLCPLLFLCNVNLCHLAVLSSYFI